MTISVITKLKENNMISKKCGHLKSNMNNLFQQIINKDFKHIRL
jgi:hypothetical protein